MKSTSTFLTATDGKRLAVRSWVPDAVRVLGSPAHPEPAPSDGGGERAAREAPALRVRTDAPPEPGSPRAVLQVAHGMAEHSGRYRRLAAAACARGIAVVADDHRGHGATIDADDERGHTGDEASWRQLLRDQDTVRDEIARTWPDAPVILLGHSWGSLIVRGSLARCDRRRVVGAVIMGTAGDPGPGARVARLLALAEARARGPRHPSAVLESQILAPYNAPFAPGRTVVDWLSRDSAEVSSYLADPLCGFTCTAGFYRDLLEAGLAVSSRRAFESIPRLRVDPARPPAPRRLRLGGPRRRGGQGGNQDRHPDAPRWRPRRDPAPLPGRPARAPQRDEPRRGHPGPPRLGRGAPARAAPRRLRAPRPLWGSSKPGGPIPATSPGAVRHRRS